MKTFNVTRFLGSKFLAALADQFMLFAVPLIILKYTGSLRWSALAFAIEWSPRLIFLPVAGHIADTINLNRLYIFADGVRTAVVAIACLLIWWHPTWAFFALSAMMACLAVLQSLAFIGMESTLPRYLPADEIPKAQSMLQISDQTSQVLGPALAGVLVSFVDLRLIMGFGSVLFFLSLINSINLPHFPKQIAEHVPLRKIFVLSYARGFKIIGQNPILTQLIALTWIVNILYGSILILSPALTTQYFGKPAHYYGFMQTTSALVCISAMSFAPYFVRQFSLPNLGALALAFLCGGATFAAMTSSWFLFAAGAICVFVGDGLFNVYIRSLRARIIPKVEFGKVTGTIILINNSSLPASGVFVSNLSRFVSQHQILAIMSMVALTLFAITLAVGKFKFKYETFLPNVNLVKGI